MAEKTLRTKIALLYKTYDEWDAIKDDYTPLKGEVCICDIPVDEERGQIFPQEPCVLLKIGNGTQTFAQLDWAYSKAADVYNWAKKENLDWNDFSEELKAKIKELIPELIAGNGITIDDEHKISVNTDDNSIITVTEGNHLSIKGYEEATQGQMLVKDDSLGLTWTNPVSTQELQEAVAAATAQAQEAGRQATASANSAVASETAAQTAELINAQTLQYLEEKFWWGTIEEYQALEEIKEGSFYFVQLN